jgi:hypothetical protein
MARKQREYVAVRVCTFEGVLYKVGDTILTAKASKHFRTKNKMIADLKKIGVSVSKKTHVVDLATTYASEGLAPPSEKGKEV